MKQLLGEQVRSTGFAKLQVETCPSAFSAPSETGKIQNAPSLVILHPSPNEPIISSQYIAGLHSAEAPK